MDSGEIVEKILSSRPDLTRQEVQKMIEKKKEGIGEFFTDETAARIVASELGVEVFQKLFQLEILIQDLVSGLNDVTVAGRVVTVYPPKTFTRRDLTEGKFAHLLIADRSGTLKVVLWDEKADFIESGKTEHGQLIKVSHGYVREGLNGKLELHVGSRGDIQSLPPSATGTKYPSVARGTRKVVDIEEEGGPITVEGTILTTPEVRQVTTSRNEKVTVASFELRDETGKIQVSAWRKLAQILKGVTVGTRIKMKNVYARKGFADQLELTTRALTSIDILTETER
jgi:replication factor A1